MAERIGQRLAELLLGAGERHRGGQSARDLGGKARPRQHRDRRLRRDLVQTCEISLPLACSMPLAQITSGCSVLQIRRQLAGDGAHMLRRRGHQQQVAIGDLVQPRGRLDRRVELDAGQIERVAVVLVDVGERLGLIGPDQHVAPGPARGDGERACPMRPRPRCRPIEAPYPNLAAFICQILRRAAKSDAYALTPAPRAGGASGSSGQRARTGAARSSVRPRGEPHRAGPGDHGGVVGAELGRRHHQAEAVRAANRVERRLEPLIGGDAAGHHQRALRLRPKPLDIDVEGARGPVADDIGHRLLEAGAEIGDVLLAERRARLHRVPERGLEPGEREMRLGPSEHRPGQGDRRRARASAWLSTAGPPG